ENVLPGRDSEPLLLIRRGSVVGDVSDLSSHPSRQLNGFSTDTPPWCCLAGGTSWRGSRRNSIFVYSSAKMKHHGASRIGIRGKQVACPRGCGRSFSSVEVFSSGLAVRRRGVVLRSPAASGSALC